MDPKSREQMLHWHTVYKISACTSPIEKNPEFDVTESSIATSNKRLSLLSANLPAEDETSLRSFLTTKINKSNGMQENSVVTNIDVPFMKDLDISTELYYKVIKCGANENSDGIIELTEQLNEDGDENIRSTAIFLVCFIVSSSGLELFQEDLDVYCRELGPFLDKFMESVDISEYLKFIEAWYENNICFVERCLKYFGHDLAVLICIGFCGDSIIIDQNIPVDVRKDIERFLLCCSLSPLFMETSLEMVPSYSSSSMQDMVTLSNSETVNITYENNAYMIHTTKTTTFCEECVEIMQQMSPNNPLKMRQLLENYKLKSIQYMNSLKRMIKEAEGDYYILYKTYTFLVTCGNGLVLLNNAKLQNSVDNFSGSKQVLDVLELFIERMGGFSHLDTTENKLALKSKLES